MPSRRVSAEPWSTTGSSASGRSQTRTDPPGGRRQRAVVRGFLGWFPFLILVVSGCKQAQPEFSPVESTLRIGVGLPPSSNALYGIAQVAPIFTTEGLVRIGEDGRLIPSLAESLTSIQGGTSIRIKLRPNAKFHDGSPVTAASVAAALRKALPDFMGPVFKDVKAIDVVDDDVEVTFDRASPFLLEALEASIEKPGSRGVATGPYRRAGAEAPNELRANADYYLGRPAIDRIIVNGYPSVRLTWAEMLRNQSDMVYDVGIDALDSLTNSKAISIFTYTRHYQYALVLNTSAPSLRAAEIRRALNLAIDREALVKDAFNGHAEVSTGLVWPQHWANGPGLPRLPFDQQHAADMIGRMGKPLRFKCLVTPPSERLALVLQRQLQAIGVEMTLEEASFDRISESVKSREFEAFILDWVSGPSLFRPYLVWHSGGLLNPGGLGSPEADIAFDRIRYASNDNEYRAAVEQLQQVFIDNPPAIFLAWGERARAVSRRFDVAAEPGRDILTTLRLWRPTNALELAVRN